MAIAISNPTIVVNNTAVAVVPNSVSYTEGKGEQTVRAQSAGGGSIQAVYSDNAESKLSKIKFSLFNTPENIAAARNWKSNSNSNAITITAPGFYRSFAQVALTNDYEVNLGADTQIDLEFMGREAA